MSILSILFLPVLRMRSAKKNPHAYLFNISPSRFSSRKKKRVNYWKYGRKTDISVDADCAGQTMLMRAPLERDRLAPEVTWQQQTAGIERSQAAGARCLRGSASIVLEVNAVVRSAEGEACS